MRAAVFLMAAIVCGCLVGCYGTSSSVVDGPKTTLFEGAELAYELHQKGDPGPSHPALVFVHGWACDRSVWREQISAFQLDYRVVALDLPGCGGSADLEGEHTMARYADAVRAVMDDASIKRAVIVGHSNGAIVARVFERRYPERTAGLVVVDGALVPIFDMEQMRRSVEPLRTAEYEAYAAQMVEGMTAPMADPGKRDAVRRTMLSTPQRVMVESFDAAADPEAWSDDAIDAPALVVNAEAPFWTEEYRRRVEELADTLEYHTIGGVSHFLMMDEPERFNGLMRAFLARRGL